MPLAGHLLEGKSGAEPLGRGPQSPPPHPALRANSQVPWILRKASKGVSAWRIMVSGQMACNSHWRMIYWWDGLGGAVSSRQDG